MIHGDALESTGGLVGHVLVERAFVDSAVTNIIFVKYYAIAAAALLYFDYAATLPDEVRRIWGARFTGATVLFVMNRYVPVFGYVVILVSLFNPPWTLSGCDMFSPFPGALNTFSQGVIMIILVLRTYALYERKLWVLVLTTSVGLVNIGIGAWAASAMTGELFTFKPIQSCVPILQSPKLDRLRFAWVSTCVFDTLIFCLTVKRTYGVMRKQPNWRKQSSLALLVMRDGSIFFLVMAVVNALNFVLFMSLTNAFFSSTTGTNSLIAHAVSVCLMNRLMINLRQKSDHYHEELPLTAETTLRNGDVFSTRIVGNLTSELVLSIDERRELDEYLGSRRSTRWIGSSVSANISFFTNAQASAPSTAHPGAPEYSGPTTAISTRPRVNWGDAVASGSGIGPSSNVVASTSRLRENIVESPSTAVDEYELETFACRCSTSPLSDETCVASFDLESKLQEHEGPGLEEVTGKGKGTPRTLQENQLKRQRQNDIDEKPG